MRSFKKWPDVIFMIVCSLMLAFNVAAASKDEEPVLIIQNANFIEEGDQYSLVAKVDVQFGPSVVAALHKGFELHYLLEFQLLHPRKYWFDDEIVTIQRPITLSYHALSRQYLLSQSGEQQAFSSLAAVRQAFLELMPVPVFNQHILEKDVIYNAVMLVRLEYKKLPSDLRESTQDNQEWHMTSPRYEWVPLFFKE